MAKFSELKVKFTGDDADLKQTMRSVNASLAEASNQARRSTIGFQAVGQSLQSVGVGLAATITAPMAALGAASLKAAGEMQQARTAFTTMLKSGEAANAMLRDLQNFALATPFEFRELQDAARRMMALGFSAQEVIPTLRTIGDAVSALGGGSEMINRVTLALGQMRAKGTAQAEEMRQLAEAGIPAWDALAKKLGVDVATAMKMVESRSVSAATAIGAVMESMNQRFAGGMEAQSKTLLGQWSNLKDQIFKTMSEIGEAMLPLATDILKNGINPLLTGLGEVAKALSVMPPTAKIAAGALAAVAFVGPLATIAIGTVLTNLGAIKAAIDGLGIALGSLKLAAAAVGWGSIAAGIYVVATSIGEYYENQRKGLNLSKQFGKTTQEVAAMVTNSGQQIKQANDATTAAYRPALNAVLAYSKTLTETSNATKTHTTATDSNTSAVKKNAGAFNELKGAMQGPKTLWEEISAVLQNRAVSEAADEVERLADAWEHVEKVKTGKIQIEPVSIDYSNVKLDLPVDWDWGAADQERASKQAEQALKDVRLQYKFVLSDAKDSMAGVKKAMQEVSTIITDMSRRITDVIFNGGKMKDVFVSVSKEIASALLRHVIQGAFVKLGKVILDSIGSLGKLGAALGKIFGSAASTAGTVAGSVGSASGGASGGIASMVGSSITGIVTAVGSAVSAVTGVISNFQNARQETTLNAIEWNTRKSSLHLEAIIGRINDGIPGFGDVQRRIVEVRDLLVSWDLPSRLSTAGAGAGAGTVNINMTGAWIGFRDMDAFIDDLVRRINARR